MHGFTKVDLPIPWLFLNVLDKPYNEILSLKFLFI